MSRNNETTLKDAIEGVLHAFKLKSKVQETQLVTNWSQIMGAMIDKHTRDVNIKNGKLYVKIDSSVVRQELIYSRSKVLEKVNEELGGDVIKEVIFL